MLEDAEVGAALAVSDLARAKQFYQDTLGLKVLSENPGGIQFGAGKGSKVFVYQSEFAGTNKATAAGFTVDDVEAVAKELKDKGVTLEHYDIPGVTMEGDVHVMGNGQYKSIWVKDPDGNILSIGNGM